MRSQTAHGILGHVKEFGIYLENHQKGLKKIKLGKALSDFALGIMFQLSRGNGLEGRPDVRQGDQLGSCYNIQVKQDGSLNQGRGSGNGENTGKCEKYLQHGE